MHREDALKAAAKEPKARLQRDRQELERKGEEVLAAVLAYLDRHLFDEDLTAAAAAEDAGTYPSWLTRHFGKHFGRRSCHAYFSDLRLETAKNLLAAHPELGFKEAGELVGGLGAKRLRRLRSESGQGPAKPVPPAPLVLRAPQAWKRLVQGELTLAEQEALRPQLRALYPDVFPAPPGETVPPGDHVQAPAIGRLSAAGGDGGATVDGLKLARVYAEREIWPLIADLPSDAQRFVVQRYVFTSTALFDLLREKSRQAGRRNPQRGVELAELALLSLDAAVLGESVHECRALGWAWLGNARRLALDFFGAEEAFKKAFEELAHVENWEDSVVAGDVYAFTSALRISQRRFEQALELMARALDTFERAGDRRRQAEGLISRASASLYAGSPEVAIADFATAVGLAKKLDAGDLRVMTTIGLGVAWIYANQFERGLAVVRTVDKRFCQRVNPLFLHLVQWIEGAGEHGLGASASAEEKYLAAHAGFEELGHGFYAAFVDLDLAILYAETNRPADVVRTSLAALCFFEPLTLGRETMLSLQILKTSLQHQAVTGGILRRFRSALRADPLAELANTAEPEP